MTLTLTGICICPLWRTLSDKANTWRDVLQCEAVCGDWHAEKEKKTMLKARCHKRLHHMFTECCYVFNVVTLVNPIQHNYFKTQQGAINAHWKRVSQLGLKPFLHLPITHSFSALLSILEELALIDQTKISTLKMQSQCELCHSYNEHILMVKWNSQFI